MDLKVALPLAFQASLMLLVGSVGLQSRWEDLYFAVTRPGMLLRGTVAIYIAMPCLALAIATLLPVEPLIRFTLVAMALSLLAPFAPGKMLKEGTGTAYAVGLYVALIFAGILVVPLMTAAFALFLPKAKAVGPLELATFVGTSALLPLLLGIGFARLLPTLAPSLAKIASFAAKLVLAAIFMVVLIRTERGVLGLLGNGAVLTMALTIAGGMAVAHVLGGAEPSQRAALAQATATRHPGIAAFMIERNALEDHRAMLALILFLLVGTVLSLLYERWVRTKLSTEPA